MTILLFPALSTSSSAGSSEKLKSLLLVKSLQICCEMGINVHTEIGTLQSLENEMQTGYFSSTMTIYEHLT